MRIRSTVPDAVVLARYDAGETLAQLASRWRVSPATVRHAIRRAGSSVGKRKPPQLIERDARIVADVAACGDMTKVAAAYGISPGRVSQIFAAARSAAARARAAREKRAAECRAARDAAIIAAFDDGSAPKQIAWQSGVSLRKVQLVIRAAGRRSRKPRADIQFRSVITDHRAAA